MLGEHWFTAVRLGTGSSESYLLLELLNDSIVGRVIRTNDRELSVTLCLDFTLQFSVFLFQHSHFFQVVSEAVVQDLHGLFLMTVDAFATPATTIWRGAGVEITY